MQRQHVKKENEGKHIAINVGAKIAMGKLFFIVDSDDALSTNAIEAIEKTEKEIAGILDIENQRQNLKELAEKYADPLTGEMKKKQMKFFPDTYRNRIGKSYNDYIADHQMNMFEDFIGYQGSAVLDEPVREEDSFSKESMSQESEISENILLPDLAKQSESIEQQSGEIAERGMPT